MRRLRGGVGCGSAIECDRVGWLGAMGILAHECGEMLSAGMLFFVEGAGRLEAPHEEGLYRRFVTLVCRTRFKMKQIVTVYFRLDYKRNGCTHHN